MQDAPPIPPRAFVIGHPVSHSRSPLLHRFWLQSLGLPGAYDPIDIPPAGLADFIAGFRQAGFVGGNVTLPHKQAVFAHLDRIAPEAAAIGAVNTIWLEAGAVVGGNTDAHGFLANLDAQAPGWATPAGHAVVLGAGGAARAVIHALRQRGLQIHIANRTRATAEALAQPPHITAGAFADLPHWLPQADLLVNTTALGMAGQPPLVIDLAPLRPAAIVCDIVYVPLATPLLRQAAARGHPTIDGLGMLLHQAAPGFAHWFAHTPIVTPALRAHLAADIARPAATRPG